MRQKALYKKFCVIAPEKPDVDNMELEELFRRPVNRRQQAGNI